MKTIADEKRFAPSPLFYRNRAALLGLYEGAGGGQDSAFATLVRSLAPELWLRMDAASDSSGKVRTVTNGGATFTAIGAVANDLSAAGKFVATSSQKVTVTNWTTGYGTFSMFAWVRPATLPVGGARIAAQRNAGCWFDWFVANDGSVTVFDGTGLRTAAPAGTVTVGTWILLGFTATGSTMTPYVNGVAGTTTTWSANTSSDDLIVGMLQLGGSNFWDGWLDELVATQQLVSAAQMLLLYNLSAKTQATISGVAVNGTKARFTFSQPATVFSAGGDFSAFKVNASGGGLVGPAAAAQISATVVDFTYASSVVSTNAWQVNDEPPVSAIAFGGNLYLKAPQSGTVA